MRRHESVGAAALRSLSDEQLFARFFEPADSWSAWMTVLRVIFGLELSDDERALFQHSTGRTAPFDGPLTEAWLLCGRRSGKSRILALIAVVLACFRDYSKYRAPGERVHVMVLAVTQDQAAVIFHYARALICETPLLKAMLENETAEELELSNGVTIGVHSASYKSVRGHTLAAVLADEISFWMDSESRNPGGAVLAAVRPGLSTIPGALLLCASSVYDRSGPAWDAFEKHFGRNDSSVMAWRAPTRTMNPSFDQAVIDRAFEEDPVSAAAEYGSEFLESSRKWMPEEHIRAAVVDEHRVALPPRPGVVYSAYCDVAAGTGRDSFTLAIGHREGDRLVTDRLLARRPPFNPLQVSEEFSIVLREYGLAHVRGDQYSGGLTIAMWAQCGVTYEPSELTTSATYLEISSAFVAQKVELLADKALLAELRGLERKAQSGGRPDKVDHMVGHHDDRAAAVCGCLLMIAQRAEHESVVPEQIAIEATQREPPDTRCRPRVLGVIIDGERAVLAKRIGKVALPSVIATGTPHELAGRIAHEAASWSAYSTYLADVSPGQPVLPILRTMNFTVLEVDPFGTPTSETYQDRRTSLAFDLALWLESASVPLTMLHELTAVSFTTKRGVTELTESPLGVCDALALTLLERAEFQDPRSIVPYSNITRAATDYDVLSEAGAADAGARRTSAMTPYHLGDREPSLARDGWARVLSVGDHASWSIRDHDPLSRG